ncbi:carbohydrate ABC transporter permease [Acidovorax cavernicola]|uniref:Carbohydrate ABC transporter permease n=1 Tax=Acidovorax cavernicola TaxID=1675792 RepID=A0A9X8GSF6_9BURK|nr:carbohydrate ABC transporter permease [Acidovorax cavernicola]RIX73870.1 carbohydrate ABC transporter permease [Acidovorax cavernicola]
MIRQDKLLRSLWCWLLLLPLVAVVIFPLAVMFLTALKPASEIYVYPARWLPQQWQWSNFSAMWTQTGFGHALLNSLLVSLSATVLTIAVSVPSAYALARLKFRGQGGYRQFLLVTQMISPVLLVVGLFKMAASIPWFDGSNMTDSRLSVVVAYGAFGIAFAVWMMSSYFETIPRDLEESAWLEGSGPVRTVLRVFLPLALPAMAVTALVTFVNAWNEFAVVYTLIRSTEKQTLTVLVTNMVAGQYVVQWELVMAAAICAVVPVAILFAWMQRYMVQGLTSGSVK